MITRVLAWFRGVLGPARPSAGLVRVLTVSLAVGLVAVVVLLLAVDPRSGDPADSAVSEAATEPTAQHAPADQAAPPAATSRRAGPTPLGVSFGESLSSLGDRELARALDDVVRIGATWIRVDVSWASVQPTSPTAHDWRALDRTVAAASQRDLHVLGILAYTPPWARRAGCGTFACPPARAGDFAAFAAAAARHLGPRGVRTFEVWNAPNIPRFWPSPDPVAYRAVLTRASAAVHAVRPDATVLVGGLAPGGPTSGAVDAGEFLAATCAGGACADVDGVAYHPYTFPALPGDDTEAHTAWERITEDSPDRPALRGVLRAAGLADLPLWLTEVGAPTRGPGAVSEVRQAEILLDAVAEARREPGEFAALFLHTWRDAARPEESLGLRRVDGTPKPALRALAELARG